MEDQVTIRTAGAATGEPARPQPALAATAPKVRLYREPLIALSLLTLVLVAYWGVWRFNFIYFDDPGYVNKENLDVDKGLPLFNNPHKMWKERRVFDNPKQALENVKWAFTAFVQSNWHPLTWLSHMLDVQLYGLKQSQVPLPGDEPADLAPKPEYLQAGDGLGAGGHHLTNLILHSCNVVMLFCLLRWLTGRAWAAALVAALFAVHPMHVESVAWVSERKDVLSTFFGFATLLAYMAYARRAKWRTDLFVIGGLLSLCTLIYVLICFDAVSHARLLDFKAAAQVMDAAIMQNEHYYWIAWIYPLIFCAALIYAVLCGRYVVLFYCAAFALYLLGLLAKPMLVTLPFIFLLLDFWPLARLSLPDLSQLRSAPKERPEIVAAEKRKPPRRRDLRSQRLREIAGRSVQQAAPKATFGKQLAGLIVEKLPFFLLASISIVLTPYAQNHGGSMASDNELSILFRLSNSTQSFFIYLVRMFYPGNMTTLYLLDGDHPDYLFACVAAVALLAITALVVWGTLKGRHYLAFGWLWYLGTLVPVIGLVQVGEQTHADRYTYIPYVGLFIMVVWGVADLIRLLPKTRKVFDFAAAFAVLLAVALCIGWDWLATKSHAVVADCVPQSISTRLLPDLTVENDYIRAARESDKSEPERTEMCRAGQHIARHAAYLGLAASAWLLITAAAVYAAYRSRRYLRCAWAWYFASLLPVIGLLQIYMAYMLRAGDEMRVYRYSNVPYVGFLLLAVWTVGEMLGRRPQRRTVVVWAARLAAVASLVLCVTWSKYQLQFWTNPKTHMEHALTIEPDNWNMLNNMGVFLWKAGDERFEWAMKAEVAGDVERAKRLRDRRQDFREKAVAQWLHGIKARPTATDIDSNLGYYYSEIGKYETAEVYLRDAVRLKKISSRPHNNLGRVLLKQSADFAGQAAALEAEIKTKGPDAAKTAKANAAMKIADQKRDEAIAEFDRSVELDNTLLEAHLNLGQVYSSLGIDAKNKRQEAEANADFDKARQHYLTILGLESESATDDDHLRNFSQAAIGLASIADRRGNREETVHWLRAAVQIKPDNMNALPMLVAQCCIMGNYRDALSAQALRIALLPAQAHMALAKNYHNGVANGMTLPLLREADMTAWIFATSPEPRSRDPEAAGALADTLVTLTNHQDALSLDTLAAAVAANDRLSDHFVKAAHIAKEAIAAANRQNNPSLANAIAQRLNGFYLHGRPYVSVLDGSDRAW